MTVQLPSEIPHEVSTCFASIAVSWSGLTRGTIAGKIVGLNFVPTSLSGLKIVPIVIINQDLRISGNVDDCMYCESTGSRVPCKVCVWFA